MFVNYDDQVGTKQKLKLQLPHTLLASNCTHLIGEAEIKGDLMFNTK